MGFLKEILLAIAVLALCGCAQIRMAQRESDAREKLESCRQRQAELQAKIENKNSSFWSDSPLANKLALPGRPVTYELLNDGVTASPVEANTLLRYRDLRREILSDSTGWWMDCMPKEVRSAYIDAYNRTTAVYGDLALGRVSFGEAAGKIDSVRQEYASLLPSIWGQVRISEQAALAEIEAQDQARDRAAAAAFAAGMAANSRPYYVPPPVSAPTQTICNRLGQQVQCTTY